MKVWNKLSQELLLLLSFLVLFRCSYVAWGLTRGWEVMHFNHRGRGSLDT